MQPALLGGLFIGILSALPIVSLPNCCCLWLIGGGIVAAYIDAQNSPSSITVRRGAFDGFTAGLVGAVVWLLASLVVGALLAPIQDRLAEEMLRRAQAMSPEARAWFQSVAGGSSSPLRYAGGFVAMLIAGMIFGTIGGMIGAAWFKKDLPPAIGGPATPPPLPNDSGLR